MDKQVLNEGGWANGTVYLQHRRQGTVVVKSYRHKNWLIRQLGRYLLKRERQAYERLRGIAGIPQVVPDADPLRLCLTHVDGRRIGNERLAECGTCVIKSLRRVVADMHARGVFHLDLRNQGNVLVDSHHQCYLIDFASSLYLPPGSMRRWLLARPARLFDQYGLSKWEDRAQRIARA